MGTADSTSAAKCSEAGPCEYGPHRPLPPYKERFCCAFADVYCENQSPWEGERQLFWDFRNASLQEWWEKYFFLGKNGAANHWVDGCFSDDVEGIPHAHTNAITRMGYTQSEVLSIQEATQRTWQRAVEKLVGAGGYNWQMFGNGDGSGAAPTQTDCASWMRQHCDATMQERPLMMSAAGGNTSLAAFLVVRPPYGYIGYGWHGCGAHYDNWNPLFELDVGEPLENCTEINPGVFSRKWSKGKASLDCNAFTATLDFAYQEKKDEKAPNHIELLAV